MALSEIEKLERRYAENPQGLTFAPLAEVHRKNGDVGRALDLLRPGLQIHPDYIPASIVLGRCHLDLGDLPGAETAFGHVLSLDGENVIALKALADINERLHHFDDAERWLQQLLSVDRSNDEARAQLERIGTARAQATEVARRSGGTPEPVLEPAAAAVSAPAEPVSEELPLEELALEELEPQAPAPIAPLPFEPPRAEVERPVPLALDDLEYTNIGSAVDEPPPAGLQVEAEHRVEAPVEPLPGIVGRDLERPVDDEFMVETSENIVLQSSGGSEFQVPDAAQELYSTAPPPEPSFFGREPPAREPKPEPEPIVAEAAPLPAESAAPAEPEVAVSEPRRAFTAAETNGQSVAVFFRQMLAARPPAGGGAAVTHKAPSPASAQPDTSAAPTRPAADALSLSSVFGEDTSAHPPAVPAPGAPASGVSFDEFFSPGGAAPGARSPRTPDAKNDDLDQFHAWLQNLKR